MNLIYFQGQRLMLSVNGQLQGFATLHARQVRWPLILILKTFTVYCYHDPIGQGHGGNNSYMALSDSPLL